jgi:hypothetical protein
VQLLTARVPSRRTAAVVGPASVAETVRLLELVPALVPAVLYAASKGREEALAGATAFIALLRAKPLRAALRLQGTVLTGLRDLFTVRPWPLRAPGLTGIQR